MGEPTSWNKVVVDLETTKLEPVIGKVLEIGAVVVDRDLTPLDGGMNVVVGYGATTLVDLCDEVTGPMHRKTGLLSESAVSSVTLAEAERQVMDYLRQHETPGAAVLLNNNSPFERAWFAEHLPVLAGFLHYRNIDATGFHEAARSWWPSIVGERGPEAHRALPDCFASIARARYYRDHLLAVPDYPAEELAGLVPDDPAAALEQARRLVAAARRAQQRGAVGT